MQGESGLVSINKLCKNAHMILRDSFPFAVAAVFWLQLPSFCLAATITVTTSSDALINGDGCSLREAIVAANGDTATNDCQAGSGADVIAFNIPGSSSPEIELTSALPVIQTPVTVDGQTQPGTSCPFSPEVSISPAPGAVINWVFQFAAGADGSSVYGLRIHSFFYVDGNRNPTFAGIAIALADIDGFTAQCNVLGVTPGGSVSGKLWMGIEALRSSQVRIGGRGGGWYDNEKGNLVVADWGTYLYEVQGIDIAGNWFGVGPPGVVTDFEVLGGAHIYNSSDVVVGVDPQDLNGGGGNVFSSAALHSLASSGVGAFGNRMGVLPSGERLPGQRFAIVSIYAQSALVEIGRWDPIGDPEHLLGNIISDGGECLISTFAWSGCGIELRALDQGEVTMAGNLLLGENAADTGESALHGLTPFSSTPQVTVSNNAFTNWAGAILSGGIDAVFSAQSVNNCLEGNQGAAILPYGGSIQFPGNWWGSPDGPSGAGNGSGDPVDPGVIYEPYLTQRPASCDLLRLAAPRGDSTIPATSPFSLIALIAGVLLLAVLVLHRSKAL